MINFYTHKNDNNWLCIAKLSLIMIQILPGFESAHM